MNDGWSKEELRASVEAYLEMQRKERQGQSYTKKRYYEDLAANFGRTEKGIRISNAKHFIRHDATWS